ncbi:MAG TPA: hypothetical protein VKU01_27080 [Bryobacteraceae bacterium]|nr:hypothetical protein [Bryobacteraceae bacterium]
MIRAIFAIAVVFVLQGSIMNGLCAPCPISAASCCQHGSCHKVKTCPQPDLGIAKMQPAAAPIGEARLITVEPVVNYPALTSSAHVYVPPDLYLRNSVLTI